MNYCESIIHLNMEIGKQFIILIAKLLTGSDFDKDNSSVENSFSSNYCHC